MTNVNRIHALSKSNVIGSGEATVVNGLVADNPTILDDVTEESCFDVITFFTSHRRGGNTERADSLNYENCIRSAGLALSIIVYHREKFSLVSRSSSPYGGTSQ